MGERTMAMNINDQACLVNLSVGYHTFRKLEKRASEAAEEKFQVAPGVLRTTKQTIAKRYLEKIVKCAGDMRTYHYTVTSAYKVKGYGVLSTKLIPDYLQKSNEMITLFNSLWEQFYDVYTEAIEESKPLEGGLHDPLEYPTIEELRRKNRMLVRFYPIPEGSHLHVAINDDDLKRMQADMEADIRESMKESMKDLWNRLYKSVGAIKERMTPDGDKAKLFRDSLILNLRELTDLLPKMNFSGDPDLDALAEDISKDLASYDPEELRTVEDNRKDALAKADSYLKRMEPIMGIVPVPSAPVAPVVAPVVVADIPDVVAPEPVPVVIPEVVVEAEKAPEAPVVKPAEVEEDNEFVKKMKEAGILF
jgi:hypothetical protein